MQYTLLQVTDQRDVHTQLCLGNTCRTRHRCCRNSSMVWHVTCSCQVADSASNFNLQNIESAKQAQALAQHAVTAHFFGLTGRMTASFSHRSHIYVPYGTFALIFSGTRKAPQCTHRYRAVNHLMSGSSKPVFCNTCKTSDLAVPLSLVALEYSPKPNCFSRANGQQHVDNFVRALTFKLLRTSTHLWWLH